MKAFLVVDLLVDFIEPQGSLYIGPAAEQLVPAVKRRLEEHRSAGSMIVFLCDRHLEDDSEFEMFPPHGLSGTGGGEVINALKPLPGERIIYKRRFCSFCGTDLDISLREKGVTEIELAGAVTNICILYTANTARSLEYKVTVSRDAVASFDQEAHRFALQELEKTLGVNLI